MRKRITLAMHHAILAHKQGLSVREAAKQCGVSYRGLLMALRDDKQRCPTCGAILKDKPDKP